MLFSAAQLNLAVAFNPLGPLYSNQTYRIPTCRKPLVGEKAALCFEARQDIFGESFHVSLPNVTHWRPPTLAFPIP